MKKNILVPLLFISVYNGQVFSHNLPHQEALSQMSCNEHSDPYRNSFMKVITLDAFEIDQWSGYDNELPESLIQSLPDVCTIYDGVGIGIIDNTCGNTDHFMKAAQAAIGYCRDKGGLSPYFLGPGSFMGASNEDTFGVHHQNYDVDQGIKFVCVELCNEPTSEEATE